MSPPDEHVPPDERPLASSLPQLERGQLVKVAPALIKRLKHHFHAVPEYSAELVLGCNGFVWIQERQAGSTAGDAEADGAAPMQDDGGWGRESDKVSVGAFW
jgi:hypothetical protein